MEWRTRQAEGGFGNIPDPKPNAGTENNKPARGRLGREANSIAAINDADSEH